MKKLLLLLFFISIANGVAFSQGISQTNDSLNGRRHIATHLHSNFYYKNLFFTKSEYRWKPTIGATMIDISAFSFPKNFYQIEAGVCYPTFFKIGLISAFMSKEPFGMFYVLPVGLKLPLVNGKAYTFSMCSNYYLLGFGGLEYDDVKKDMIHYKAPLFMDNQVRFETNLLGISAILGYRLQFSPWQSFYESSNKVIASYSLSGGYIGISIGFKYTWAKSKGVEAWEKAKYNNSYCSYSDFVDKYTDGPFSIEAERKVDSLQIAHDSLIKRSKKLTIGLSIDEVSSIIGDLHRSINVQYGTYNNITVTGEENLELKEGLYLHFINGKLTSFETCD